MVCLRGVLHLPRPDQEWWSVQEAHPGEGAVSPASETHDCGQEVILMHVTPTLTVPQAKAVQRAIKGWWLAAYHEDGRAEANLLERAEKAIEDALAKQERTTEGGS